MSNEKNDILRPKPEVRIFKEIELDNGKVQTATKIMVHVLYWTEFPGETLAYHNLINTKRGVILQLKLVGTEKGRRYRQLVPITYCEVFEDGKNQKKFTFNSEKNCNFSVEIDYKFDERPESTKKKIVIYEDTDIIDDTETPE